MTNTLTPEQIAQLLEAAEKTMGGGAGHYLQIRDLIFALFAPIAADTSTDEQAEMDSEAIRFFNGEQ